MGNHIVKVKPKGIKKEKQIKKEEIESQEIDEPIQLPIEWNIPENMIAKYATNMVVQTEKEEFILSFFQIKPPLFFNAEDRDKKMKDNAAVKAECIVRLIISPERLPRYIKLLQKAMDRHQRIYKEKEKL